MQFIDSVTTTAESVAEDVGSKLVDNLFNKVTYGLTTSPPKRILIFYDASSTEYNGRYFENLRQQIQGVTFGDKVITFVLYLTVSRRCFFRRKVPKKWDHHISRYKRRLKMKFKNISVVNFEYKFFEKHNTKFDPKMLQSEYVKPDYVVVDAQILNELAVILDAFIKNADGSYTEFKQKANTILENVNTFGIAGPGAYATKMEQALLNWFRNIVPSKISALTRLPYLQAN